MAYLSLYRKYRPQTFDELVGQKHVARTLVNALEQGKVAHAYLFCGPRGTGKTTTARLLAKALNCTCEPDHEAGAECDMCRAIAEGTAMDVIEMDAASNRGIDEIRALRERIHFAPTQGAYKVYIVDEVHMLTPEAFNALLKVLEEPPPNTIFVLCTTEVHKVPATIASRCQRFDFRRISVNDLVGRLEHIAGAEAIDVEEGGLYEIALHAQGSMRDAISTLDQLAAFTDRRISLDDITGLLGVVQQELLFEAADSVADADAKGALRFVARALESGYDPSAITRGLLGHMRNLYVTCAVGDASGILDVPPELHQRLVAQSRRFTERDLERVLAVLSVAQTELKGAPDPRLVLETSLVRVARPVEGLDELAERVGELERRLRHGPGGGHGVASSAPARPQAAAKTAPAPAAEKAAAEAEAAQQEIPAAEAERNAVAEAPEAASADVETDEETACEAGVVPLTTEGILSCWTAFLTAIQSAPVAGALMDAAPAVTDGVLHLQVADETHQAQLSSPRKMERLEAAARSVFGRPVRVQIDVGGKPAERRAVRRGETGYPVRLKEELGAEKVTEIRKNEDDSEA